MADGDGVIAGAGQGADNWPSGGAQLPPDWWASSSRVDADGSEPQAASVAAPNATSGQRKGLASRWAMWRPKAIFTT